MGIEISREEWERLTPEQRETLRDIDIGGVMVEEFKDEYWEKVNNPTCMANIYNQLVITSWALINDPELSAVNIKFFPASILGRLHESEAHDGTRHRQMLHGMIGIE